MEKYNIIIGFCVINLLLTIYLNILNRKEYFQTPKKESNILLLDNNGNLETMGLNEIYNSLLQVKKECLKYTLTEVNKIKATLKRHSYDIENNKSKIKFIEKNYVQYNQEMGLQGVHGCGNPSKGVWLDPYRGPFRNHSDQSHQNTRWFIRKRCGGCGKQYCKNQRCMVPGKDLRGSTSNACK